MSCGAETEANDLLTALTAGLSVTIPTVNLDDALLKLPATLTDKLYAKVAPIPVGEVTTGVVNGTGVFDVLMNSISAHLKVQFEKGRITGNEYTQTYIQLTQAAMGTASSFVLSREQTFWQAQQAQAAVITARVALETEKVKHAVVRVQFETAKSEYGLAKMKISSESMAYCTAKYNLETMLPQQLAISLKQGDILQEDLLGKGYTRSYILPAQMTLLTEQGNVQRAQTNDYRADATLIAGLVAGQKSLYAQQVVSYQRDAEVKAAKLFGDTWITQKTLDEGLLPPAGLNNDAVNAVFQRIRTANGML